MSQDSQIAKTFNDDFICITMRNQIINQKYECLDADETDSLSKIIEKYQSFRFREINIDEVSQISDINTNIPLKNVGFF